MGLRILSLIIYLCIAWVLIQFFVHLGNITESNDICNVEDSYTKGFKKNESGHNYSIEPIHNLDIRKINDLIYN